MAVTGGTGFFGRYCVAALSAAGWQVRLLARRDHTHPMLTGITPELVPGDLADEAALARLVRGADAVLHVAGLVKTLHPRDFQAVNVGGTARLAAITRREAPGARFVLISSQAARAPALSAYAASKRAAEQAVIAALGRAGWVIVRACVIYGPWDREGEAVLRLARQRYVPVPAAPSPRLAMIHARDAAAAVAALCAPGPSGVTYELSDGVVAGHAWQQIIRLAAPDRHSPRFVPVPDAVMRAAGAASDRWATLRRRPSIFGAGKVAEILHRDWRPDPAMAPPPALWLPHITLADGMTETAAWWRNQGSGPAPAGG